MPRGISSRGLITKNTQARPNVFFNRGSRVILKSSDFNSLFYYTIKDELISIDLSGRCFRVKNDDKFLYQNDICSQPVVVETSEFQGLTTIKNKGVLFDGVNDYFVVDDINTNKISLYFVLKVEKIVNDKYILFFNKNFYIKQKNTKIEVTVNKTKKEIDLLFNTIFVLSIFIDESGCVLAVNKKEYEKINESVKFDKIIIGGDENGENNSSFMLFDFVGYNSLHDKFNREEVIKQFTNNKKVNVLTT